MSYRSLRDYGLLGDMRTAALVSRSGSLDWCCLPRFDSASVFGRLLDHRRGGHWAVRPAGIGTGEGSQEYESGTNVLVTRFGDRPDPLRLRDFMPVLESDRRLAGHHEIHRRLEAPGQAVEAEVVLRPRFDYGRREPRFRRRSHGILATDGMDEAIAVAGVPDEEWTISDERAEARARIRLDAGEERSLVLRYDEDEVWAVEEYGTDRKLEATRRFWREWSEGLSYRGEHPELVERSALALKLLTYAPSGALVAAPTTSLPEVIGGKRNWDYRFSWLRDATFALFAFHALGKYGELDRYMVYLKKVCRMEADHMQIMFGVEGERNLAERVLEHFEGYEASGPVRIGNGAADQFQLDIYGEVLDAVHIWHEKHEMTEGMWELCRRLADQACDRWRERDHGVWEMRGGRRHFVFSKVMAWAALDRAVRLAEDTGLDGDVERWRRERDAVREAVLERGWSEERRAFVQHFGSDRLDAANLALPFVRFLPPDDRRVLATVDAIREELAHPSGLLYRYRNDDGLDGEEGAFWVSSFQLVQALARGGREEEARRLFDAAVEHAGPLGLFSEQVDPESGRMLGNFPQAFTHIGLINAAHVLARNQQDEGPPRVRGNLRAG